MKEDIMGLMMPESEGEELDLGLEEMELEGDESPEIKDMIAKLEAAGYTVSKAPAADEDESLEEMDMPEG